VSHDEIGVARHRKLQDELVVGIPQCWAQAEPNCLLRSQSAEHIVMLSTTQSASPTRPASRLATASYSRTNATETMGCQRGSPNMLISLKDAPLLDRKAETSTLVSRTTRCIATS
jgi:hypothetical protein